MILAGAKGTNNIHHPLLNKKLKSNGASKEEVTTPTYDTTIVSTQKLLPIPPPPKKNQLHTSDCHGYEESQSDVMTTSNSCRRRWETSADTIENRKEGSPNNEHEVIMTTQIRPRVACHHHRLAASGRQAMGATTLSPGGVDPGRGA